MGGYEETDRYDWFTARDICIIDGGNLVSIHDKEVQGELNLLGTGDHCYNTTSTPHIDMPDM